MSAATSPADAELRAGCVGITPLTARLEAWQREVCAQPDLVAQLLRRHGSPVNLIHTGPLARNADELRAAAEAHGVALDVYFARKANKSLALVDAARSYGLGVDLASQRELEQCLDRGVPGSKLMMTAAIKPEPLLERCVDTGVVVAVDNRDELVALRRVARAAGRPARIALRLAPALEGPPTRFGLELDQACAVGRELGGTDEVSVAGVHFHVDGYAAGYRVAAAGQALGLVDDLRAAGHAPEFVDIGGGIPMRYLDHEEEWRAFWDAHRAALDGDREALTYRGHTIGPVYPGWQDPVRGVWLDGVLGASHDGETVAAGLRRRGLALRIEPGRSLLDGAGLTAARVEFRKPRGDGTWLIGLAMNRTQCRSAADDFLVDPLLLRPSEGQPDGHEDTGPVEGHLVGAYCIERELLTWRRLRFPGGVMVGDVVVFPNTAGYFMHILESASHQIPLARNLVRTPDGFELDPIDSVPTG